MEYISCCKLPVSLGQWLPKFLEQASKHFSSWSLSPADNLHHCPQFQLSRSLCCCFLSCVPAPCASCCFFLLPPPGTRPQSPAELIHLAPALCWASPSMWGHTSQVREGSPKLPGFFPLLSCSGERGGECGESMWHFFHHKLNKCVGALWFRWEFIIAFFQVLSLCPGGELRGFSEHCVNDLAE